MGQEFDASTADAEVVTLADGGRVLVRSLVASDRDELAERYLQLTPEARRLRFFNAPDHLSERLLDYLMDVDGPDRCALVAVAIDDDGAPGVGLARYVRSRDDRCSAEAAVTVLDSYQSRGIATSLLHCLADHARRHDISTFTASVMWENGGLLDGLRAFGAEVAPSEPGVASVRIGLPGPDVTLPESELQRALRIFAAQLDRSVGLRFER